VRWTKAYRKLAGKELAEDATFELERRRNRPEKYNRETVAKTVKAIEKIADIRKKRQDRFYEKRMVSAKKQKAAADRRELEQEIHLVKAPASLTDKSKQKLKVGGWAGGRAGAWGRTVPPGCCLDRPAAWLAGAMRQRTACWTSRLVSPPLGKPLVLTSQHPTGSTGPEGRVGGGGRTAAIGQGRGYRRPQRALGSHLLNLPAGRRGEPAAGGRHAGVGSCSSSGGGGAGGGRVVTCTAALPWAAAAGSSLLARADACQTCWRQRVVIVCSEVPESVSMHLFDPGCLNAGHGVGARPAAYLQAPGGLETAEMQLGWHLVTKRYGGMQCDWRCFWQQL
jgi:hypothetical protein